MTELTVCPGQPWKEMDAAQLAPLTLAYVGDTVFDLYVRTQLILQKTGNAGAMHARSAKVVNARAQAAFARKMEPQLNEAEKNIFMRGRNAKNATVPKNMSPLDYRYATAIEAVVGYLYLSGNCERMNALFEELDFTSERNE